VEFLKRRVMEMERQLQAILVREDTDPVE